MTAGSGEGAGDLLTAVVAAARRRVEVQCAREPLAALARRVEADTARPFGFFAALSAPGGVHVIAECKRRSPSRGVLRQQYDAAAIARGYAQAGAAAISVLTEPTFFDGSLEDLRAVRAVVDLPVLRKDFIVSEYQLLEARAAGANAVLLIAAVLSREELRTLGRKAAALGLDALVEVHGAGELSAAIDAGATIVGVNNRNLRTLEVNVGVSEELIGRMPAGVVAVSESGLKTAGDLARLLALGYRGFLIGERFMSEDDPGRALGALLAAVNVGIARERANTSGAETVPTGG